MYLLISVVKLLLSSFILFLQTSSIFSSEASSTYTGIPSCISMISGVLPHISKHLYWVMLIERIVFSLYFLQKYLAYFNGPIIYYFYGRSPLHFHSAGIADWKISIYLAGFYWTLPSKKHGNDWAIHIICDVDFTR